MPYRNRATWSVAWWGAGWLRILCHRALGFGRNITRGEIVGQMCGGAWGGERAAPVRNAVLMGGARRYSTTTTRGAVGNMLDRTHLDVAAERDAATGGTTPRMSSWMKRVCRWCRWPSRPRRGDRDAYPHGARLVSGDIIDASSLRKSVSERSLSSTRCSTGSTTLRGRREPW